MPKKPTKKPFTLPAPRKVRIKLKPNETVRLVAPSGYRPVVAPTTAPHAVEVAPISKKKGWAEYLFGDWTKG